MAITLAELKQQCRERADMTDSQFVTDSELVSYINSSIAELHDILIQSYGNDYYVKEVSFNTVVNQADYDLSTVVTDDDFYKLRGVDAKLSGNDYFTLRPFNFNERNRSQDFIGWNFLNQTNVRYRLLGNNIRFNPLPTTVTEIRLWYIPVAQKLSLDTDELSDFNQYAEYVIVDVAIKMLNKEESDVTVLMNQKVALKRRIEESAQNRDAESSESVSDIYNDNNDIFFGRSSS